MATNSLEKMEASLNLTEAEQELVQVAATQTMANTINRTRILSQIHLSRKLEAAAGQVEGAMMGLQVAIKESTEKVMESNRKLAASNRRYAMGLNILTGALVLVTLAQVLLPFIG